MTRLAVTGSSGFIGRRLVARLRAEGHEVAALDRVDPPHRLEGVRYLTGDLVQDLTRVEQAWQGQPWHLIHLAWPMARGTAWLPQTEAVSILAALLDRWQEGGPTRLVVTGSAEEYGQRAGALREEDEPVLPLTPYGWSKRAAGLMANSWARRLDRTLVWVRPFIVYGPGQTGTMALPYAMAQARAGQPAEFSDALQQRDFIHVDDVVEALQLAATRAQLSGVQVCNLGWGLPVRLRDVLEELGRGMQALDHWRWGARPRRPGEPDLQVAEASRAAEVLGWRPHIPWREGISAWVAEVKGSPA